MDPEAIPVEDSGPQVVTPGTANVRMGPLGFHIRANDFFELAEVGRAKGRRYVPVAALLYCRSVELALKAYLLARGQTLDQVARLGHDLEMLLVEAYARGLDVVAALTEGERRVVLDMHGHYQSSKLAYFDLFETISGSLFTLPLDDFASVASKLLAGVERGCYESAHGGWRPF
jgi:HEPN domain-containing protein